MGNFIPISQVRDDVAVAYKKEMEWRTTELLLPYRKLCLIRKVNKVVLIVETRSGVITGIKSLIHFC